MPTGQGSQGPPQQTTRTMQWPLPSPDADEPAGERRRWLRWAVPLLAFLIGLGVGGVGEQPDPTTTPQYLTLQDDLQVAQDQAGALTDEVAAAEEQIRQAGAAAEARLAEQTAAIAQRSTALDQREQGLVARESALRAAEAAPGSSGSSAGAGSGGSPSSSGSATSGSVASGAGRAPAAEPAPRAPVSTYFDNCTAARTAGAAPVRAGDPGYGRHLDRDGDGVGCE
ncbi:Excalibur calcium-binding domain-containing protein [Geodermatophilus pulveris]|uniref:Excalibur calcium-binding domain-containing protein n=1 Tax=Geodermatophilus pulveris TaxID=1564159 RepID=A0A239I693_9ACTN|nr:excalibur calcium-binding domain-containing protein [Geodermatophilus pulveris]SNS89406.1 Excalibur calcium-binding domain-containing protein [Geodermatophilus pulveris]